VGVGVNLDGVGVEMKRHGDVLPQGHGHAHPKRGRSEVPRRGFFGTEVGLRKVCRPGRFANGHGHAVLAELVRIFPHRADHRSGRVRPCASDAVNAPTLPATTAAPTAALPPRPCHSSPFHARSQSPHPDPPQPHHSSRFS